MRLSFALLVSVCLLSLLGAEPATKDPHGYIPLFPEDGVPKGWRVTEWSDVGKPAAEGVRWIVKEGILHGSQPRGTWLMSEKEYGDFVLEFEWKIGERGNSGLGIRVPKSGDPAFDGLEIQMADERYNQGQDGPDKLTGAIYWAVAPTKQVYKPMEWNHYRITAQGPRIKVELNGELVQDLNLDEHTKELVQHGNKPAKPLRDRPRRGSIGFQELSRSGQAMIRNAKIREL